jgi:hypothetical protein
VSYDAVCCAVLCCAVLRCAVLCCSALCCVSLLEHSIFSSLASYLFPSSLLRFFISFVQLERLCNTTVEQTFEAKAVVAEAGCKVRRNASFVCLITTFYLILLLLRHSPYLYVSYSYSETSSFLYITSMASRLQVDWVLCVVRSGMLKVIEREPTQTIFEYRGEGKFFSRCELAPEGVIAGSPLLMSPDPVSSYNSGMALVGSRRFISSSPLRQYSTVLSQGVSTVVFVPLTAFLDFVGSKGNLSLRCDVL